MPFWHLFIFPSWNFSFQLISSRCEPFKCEVQEDSLAIPSFFLWPAAPCESHHRSHINELHSSSVMDSEGKQDRDYSGFLEPHTAHTQEPCHCKPHRRHWARCLSWGGTVQMARSHPGSRVQRCLIHESFPHLCPGQGWSRMRGSQAPRERVYSQDSSL